MLSALVACIAAGVVAVPWTLWAKYVASHMPHKAGLADAALTVIGGVTTATIIESRWNIVPAALGAYMGTVITMRFRNETS